MSSSATQQQRADSKLSSWHTNERRCWLFPRCLSLLLFLCPLLQAQNSLNNTGIQDSLSGTGPSFAAPYPAEMGTVDAGSGNLHLEIPLASYPQRGNHAPITTKFVYDSRMWVPQYDSTSRSFVWTILGLGDGISAPRTYQTWSLESGTNAFLIGTGDRFTITNSTVTYCETDYLLWDSSGTQRFFTLVSTDPSAASGCPGGNGSAYAADSSGYFLQATSSGISVYAPDGTLVFNDFVGYIQGELGEGSAQGTDPDAPYILAKDSNGNFINSNSNGFLVTTDMLGRAIGSTAGFGFADAYVGAPPCCAGPTTFPAFNSQDTTAGTSNYTINTATIPVKTHFQQTGIVECIVNCTAQVIQSVVLPDGTQYSFLYDCDSSTHNAACNSPAGQTGYYGTLTSMTLPTAQTITYGYANFKDAAGNINHWLTSKKTGSASWGYTPAVTASGGWKTTYSCASPATADGCQQVTVVRPDASKEITTFAVNNGAFPTTTASYDTNGATLLSTVSTSWDFSNPCTLSICFTSWSGNPQQTGNGSQYVRKLATLTTLPVPGGSVTKKTAYGYDSPQKGNVTAIKEWGFRSGTALTAVFPSTPDRATYTTFATIGTNNIINRPTVAVVCSNSGTDSDCPGGGAKVAKTTITYDAYGSNGSQALKSVTGVVNHDDTDFGISYAARGNPTLVSHWVSGTSSGTTCGSTCLTTALSYDTTGQVVGSVDSKGNSTAYSYADVFYYDNGLDPPPSFTPTDSSGATITTNAYATSVTDPGGTTSIGYYYGSGHAALTSDYNAQTTYSHYVDPFDRPTESDFPIGWSVNTYTSPTQFDTYATIADTAFGNGGCSFCVHAQFLTDPLSRVTSRSLANNPSGQTFVTSTYDGMNRASTVSHPNFGASDPNNVVETPHYDGLGRSLGVTHPDNQATKIAYGAAVTALGGLSTQQNPAYGVGFPVLSVDEAGNLRQEWSDGLGRAIEVDEPSGAGGLKSPYVTNYTYDALGNLTSVVQGVQTRHYSYDGLNRLTQEITPEAGTVTFSYIKSGTTLCSGDPSNLCSTTDARGIVTTYAYDSANRPATITHSDTTGTVNYTYGTSAIAYNIGRLLTMSDPSGSETYTYDQMGRVTSLTKVVAGSSYITAYQYNLGGQLTQITYPSGRNIYYIYDFVGHLCQVSATAQGRVFPVTCTATSPYLTIGSNNYDAAGRPLVAEYGNGIHGIATYSPNGSQLVSLSHGKTVYSVGVSSISVGGICYLQFGELCSASASVSSTVGVNIGDSITVTGNSVAAFNGTFTISDIFPNTIVYGSFRAQAGQTGTGGTITSGSGSTSLLSLNYYYQHDSTNCPSGNTLNNGQVQCISDSSAGTGDSGRSIAYTYDYLGRLSTAITTGSSTFGKWGLSETYDRYGNRSAQSALPGTVGTVPQPSFSINAANNQINTAGYTYDASGHLTAEPAPFNTSYTYDGEDCLTNYHSGLNGNTATYTCDGNHLRVQKVVTGPNAVTTVSIYSGGRVIAEYDGGAAVTSPTREYIYGHNLLATVTGSTAGSGGTIVYQHRDTLGPRLYTDANGNDIGEQGTFPFGEPWYSNNSTSNWVFTTYERDNESGIDYALARSYYGSEGRFMSPDPLEGNPSDPQSWNRYAYVENDPINLTDPSGQSILSDFVDFLGGLFDAIFTGNWSNLSQALNGGGLGSAAPDCSGIDCGGSELSLAYAAPSTPSLFSGGGSPGAGGGWGAFQGWGGALYRFPGQFLNTFNTVLYLGVTGIYDEVFAGPVALLKEANDNLCGSDGSVCAMVPVVGAPVAVSERVVGATSGLLDAMRAQGRIITIAEEGSEELRYLDAMRAEANAGGPDQIHIILRQNATKAAAMEEFLHGTQNRLGIIDRLGVQGAEAHVADFMARHKNLLGLEP